MSAMPMRVKEDLTRIPGVGPSIAADLYRLGIQEVAELRGQNPEAMYEETCRLEGVKVDRCVLYVYRCAVYFASEARPEKELLQWWKWKDDPRPFGLGRGGGILKVKTRRSHECERGTQECVRHNRVRPA